MSGPEPMTRYQVVLVPKPPGWQPAGLDAVPPTISEPVELLETVSDLFCAVARAIEHNGQATGADAKRWAVVVDPDCPGCVHPCARLCTPLRYLVSVIWWPEGWEPNGPLDVPNCVWQAEARPADVALDYPKAEAIVHALNRQCMDSPGAAWHVVAAVENEPVSRTVSYDASGTESTAEVHRMHVIRPERGSTGDCSHCPAHSFPCAKDRWRSLIQPVATHSTRPLAGQRGD
ncbi:MAG: hypothetical protein RBS80_15520 [Thermoguttaceae bacterium]|nr:hypothetical protein [Thermoguttaceae bacterium]